MDHLFYDHLRSIFLISIIHFFKCCNFLVDGTTTNKKLFWIFVSVHFKQILHDFLHDSSYGRNEILLRLAGPIFIPSLFHLRFIQKRKHRDLNHLPPKPAHHICDMLTHRAMVPCRIKNCLLFILISKRHEMDKRSALLQYSIEINLTTITSNNLK